MDHAWGKLFLKQVNGSENAAVRSARMCFTFNHDQNKIQNNQ